MLETRKDDYLSFKHYGNVCNDRRIIRVEIYKMVDDEIHSKEADRH